MLYLRIEFFLTSDNFDEFCLGEFIKKFCSFSFYLYYHYNDNKQLFFSIMELKCENDILENRQSLTEDFFEIFDDLQIISIGCNNIYSTAYFHEEIIYSEKIIKCVIQNTFLTSVLISFIEHEVWKKLFLPYKTKEKKWVLFHFTNFEQIKNYKKGTYSRNLKSQLSIPFNYNIEKILDIQFIKNHEKLPLKINFDNLKNQTITFNIEKDFLNENLNSIWLNNSKKFKSKIPILKK